MEKPQTNAVSGFFAAFLQAAKPGPTHRKADWNVAAHTAAVNQQAPCERACANSCTGPSP
jgi:hypothetical protein